MNESIYRPQRNWGARILEYAVKGMRAVFLENEKLRVGVLVGKGTDVFEFNYKAKDMDFIRLTPGGIRNPTSYLSTSLDPLATFVDYYLGGWQEVFPSGGAPSSYLGAQFGQHGEVSQLPWDYEIIEDSESTVAIRFSVRTQKTPFHIEKVFRLRSGESSLQVDETVTNESGVSLRAMWGQHIAFGYPFLREGCRIHLPRGVKVIADREAINPKGRRVLGGQDYLWPIAESADGSRVDLSILPARGESSDIVYLTSFRDGWYELENPRREIGIRVAWDAETMPYLWFWQEFGASEEYPWYGRHYTIGLEPFSSYPTNGIAEAVSNDTALSIGAHEERSFCYRVEVRE